MNDYPIHTEYAVLIFGPDIKLKSKLSLDDFIPFVYKLISFMSVSEMKTK